MSKKTVNKNAAKRTVSRILGYTAPYRGKIIAALIFAVCMLY